MSKVVFIARIVFKTAGMYGKHMCILDILGALAGAANFFRANTDHYYDSVIYNSQ